MIPWSYILHEGEKCTGCQKPYFRKNIVQRGSWDSSKRFGITVLICGQCAKILALENGKIRSLTAEEIKRLPTHQDADLIKSEHKRILEKLWG